MKGRAILTWHCLLLIYASGLLTACGIFRNSPKVIYTNIDTSKVSLSLLDTMSDYFPGDTLYIDAKIVNSGDREVYITPFSSGWELCLITEFIGSPLCLRGVDNKIDSMGLLLMKPGEKIAIRCALIDSDKSINDSPGESYDMKLVFMEIVEVDNEIYKYSLRSKNKLRLSVIAKNNGIE